MSDMTDALMPCPFCGDPMERWAGDTVRHVDFEAQCLIVMQGFMVRQWNRYTRHAALTAAQAQLAEQRDEYEGYMAILTAERGEVLALRKRVAELTTERDDYADQLGNLLPAINKEAVNLRTENAALAAWQCLFTDGQTGLVNDEYGNQFCQMRKRAEKAEARVAELEGALENFNPRRIGHRQSLSHDSLDLAWGNARAALEGKT